MIVALKPKSTDHILVESMGPLSAVVNESDLPVEQGTEEVEEDVEIDDDDGDDEDIDEEMEEEEMEQVADKEDSLVTWLNFK